MLCVAACFWGLVEASFGEEGRVPFLPVRRENISAGFGLHSGIGAWVSPRPKPRKLMAKARVRRVPGPAYDMMDTSAATI